MMDKPENIPSGKYCRGEDFICPWLYDQFVCELVHYDKDNDCGDGEHGAARLPSCLAAYPHGGTVKIEVNP